MTDELLYERLAIERRPHAFAAAARARRGGLEPQPALSAADRAGVSAPDRSSTASIEAHVLNAWVMSSACIPAFLLARRRDRERGRHSSSPSLTRHRAVDHALVVPADRGRRVPGVRLGAARACRPSIARPSVRNDLLAVRESRSPCSRARSSTRSRRSCRSRPRDRRTHSSARARSCARAPCARRRLRGRRRLRIGARRQPGTACSDLCRRPQATRCRSDLWRSLPPTLRSSRSRAGCCRFCSAGPGWSRTSARARRRERQLRLGCASSRSSSSTVEVASFDLRFGGGLVRERYLFYLTPLLLLAFAARCRPRAAPLVAARPARRSSRSASGRRRSRPFEKLNVDTPASILVRLAPADDARPDGARESPDPRRGRRSRRSASRAAAPPARAVRDRALSLLLVALPAETGYAFKRLFASTGRSGLPLTLDQSAVFGGSTGQITANVDVTMVPYPRHPRRLLGERRLLVGPRVLERSVEREAGGPNEFSGTPAAAFPKIHLRFDPRTGRGELSTRRVRHAGGRRGAVPTRRRSLRRRSATSRPDSPDRLARRLGLLRPLRRRLDEARPPRRGSGLRAAPGRTARCRTHDHLDDARTRDSRPPLSCFARMQGRGAFDVPRRRCTQPGRHRLRPATRACGRHVPRHRLIADLRRPENVERTRSREPAACSSAQIALADETRPLAAPAQSLKAPAARAPRRARDPRRRACR